MCICVGVGVYMSIGAQEGQKRALDILGLELWSHPTCVLENNLVSSAKVVHAPNHWTIPLVPSVHSSYKLPRDLISTANVVEEKEASRSAYERSQWEERWGAPPHWGYR